MTPVLLRPRLGLVAGLLAFALLAASCGQDSEVARILGASLSEDDLRTIVAETEGDAPSAPTEVATDAVSEWLFWELLIAETADRGYPLTEDDLAAGREVLTASAPDGAGPDLDSDYAEIVTRYRAVPRLVARYLEEGEGVVPVAPAILCSSHILLDTEAEAEAALTRYEAGEDFAELARELSTGPTGPDGGDLGCVDSASFVPEFVAGAAQVDPPGVSAPTQSQFGWHVIFVESFEASDFPDQTARDQAVFAAGESLLIELQTAALAREVDVDSRFGVWDSDTGQLVPADG